MEDRSVKIKIRNVRKVFGKNSKEVIALDDVNLDVKTDRFTTIVGPSGCGKSTLLYMLAGFEKPTAGEIYLDGRKISAPGPDRGFVFQDYALFPWKTVLGNVMFGLINNGRNKKTAQEIALHFINLVNLNGFENAYPHTLSGGMKQRVAIARALADDPEVLLMDEPFGALDAQTRKYMQSELIKVWEKYHKTVIFVTHSVVEAAFLSDVVVVMSARPGKPKDIFEAPFPRVRDYTSDHFVSFRKEILDCLEDEVRKEIEMNHL